MFEELPDISFDDEKTTQGNYTLDRNTITYCLLDDLKLMGAVQLPYFLTRKVWI
jgi:hypothetical protein